MKILTTVTLSALTIFIFNTKTFANQVVLKSSSSINSVEISPFNLVNAAYQGRLSNQGIPSNSAFLFAVRANRIKAEDLVNAAISSNRLSQQALNDNSYLNSVTGSINSFKRRRF